MSKNLFHQMRAQGHDVDDSGNMYQEQEYIQQPNTFDENPDKIVFGCRVNPLTKQDIQRKYGIEIK